MIYITGDTHGEIDVHKLSKKYFNYNGMSKDDFIIICGDFGFVWTGTKKDDWWLNWLEDLPCTILFVDGNHENFNALNRYPVENWHGGKVHKIREHVIHLMRGQTFKIEDKTFFTFGGASSHDKWIREENKTWWAQEIATSAEMMSGVGSLEQTNNEVDYIITHCCSTTTQYKIAPWFEPDVMTQYLNFIEKNVKFKHWYFGHYHIDKDIGEFYTCLYNRIVRIQ